MRYTVSSLITLDSVAAALPAPEQPADPWEGVIDPWGQYGHKPENVKRTTIELDGYTANSPNFRIAGQNYLLTNS